jgi:hypothetical protein
MGERSELLEEDGSRGTDGVDEAQTDRRSGAITSSAQGGAPPYWLSDGRTPASLLSCLQRPEFVRICHELLLARGFAVVTDPRAEDLRIDMLCEATDGSRVVVDCRHHQWEPGWGLVRRTIDRLMRARVHFAAGRAMLLLASPLPDVLRREYSEHRHWLSILDVREIDVAVRQYDDVHRSASALIKAAFGAFDGTQNQGLRNASPFRNRRVLELLLQLARMPTGRASAAAYEDLVVEVLNYAFYPSLGIPTQQSRSDDGLDLRDIVYPIRNQHWFWQEMRSCCRTRFVVVECKNHAEAPGQREVESLQQYLFDKAMRTVGLLVARQRPSPSALVARRRAWLEYDKLILFLSDDDLAELLLAKSRGEDPEELLDLQLDLFLGSLVP